MHPADINAAIKKAGTTQAAIASAICTTPGAVSSVINGLSRSKRIATAVSKVVGKSMYEVFPEYSRPNRKQRSLSKARSMMLKPPHSR